ncbi:Acyl-CoA-binding protein, ACBP, conserved site,FERM/acyl-CoA-binding protein, 3-helical bundle,Acyl- [Cinara cedri]|uniref:Acyl-CoA-binding protein, ACBP, conserved site,FERM/acyl-CoA-binding protein, 3-helical bundle,Acyl n=1 Tax=Cinara cedri TaxID=506608 RepID=A0A5E4MU14_9HEMI|nr:Acyl-CoA-binding protein, ACBP, conserved site,FERM/acyl-CoA-binding protein, 3-helical bundle,Acyl- [Cinara cedri]
MASLQERFDEAAEKVKSLTKRPTNEELLLLYGLYKQATIGDNTTSKPGLFDLKAAKKWEFWTNLKGTSKEECQQKYIDNVEDFLGRYA